MGMRKENGEIWNEKDGYGDLGCGNAFIKIL